MCVIIFTVQGQREGGWSRMGKRALDPDPALKSALVSSLSRPRKSKMVPRHRMSLAMN